MSLFLYLVFSWPPVVIRAGIISSYAMVGAAIFLWITFVIFGIIAKRYEQVLKKKTQWQFILIAPSGIIVYAILKFYSSVIFGNLKMAGIIEIIAYVFSSFLAYSHYLVLSGLEKLYHLEKEGIYES